MWRVANGLDNADLMGGYRIVELQTLKDKRCNHHAKARLINNIIERFYVAICHHIQ